MACQQQEELLSYDHERPPPSLALELESSEPFRPSWNCVLDIDIEHKHYHDCNLPLTLNKKSRRSVSFQSSSTLFCYEIPEGEPQDWYTGEDEDIFKAEAQKELAVFRRMKGGFAFAGASGQSVSDSDPQYQRNMCIVGLEQQLISPEFSKKRKRTKKLVKYAVLREQSKIGTGHGNINNKVERIAQAARRYSEWSAAKAKMFGDFQYIQSKESK
jgi:hypothetical protein